MGKSRGIFDLGWLLLMARTFTGSRDFGIIMGLQKIIPGAQGGVVLRLRKDSPEWNRFGNFFAQVTAEAWPSPHPNVKILSYFLNKKKENCHLGVSNKLMLSDYISQSSPKLIPSVQQLSFYSLLFGNKNLKSQNHNILQWNKPLKYPWSTDLTNRRRTY